MKVGAEAEKLTLAAFGRVPQRGRCQCTAFQRTWHLLADGSGFHVQPGSAYVCLPESRPEGLGWEGALFCWFHECAHALRGASEQDADRAALKAMPAGSRLAAYRQVWHRQNIDRRTR